MKRKPMKDKGNSSLLIIQQIILAMNKPGQGIWNRPTITIMKENKPLLRETC